MKFFMPEIIWQGLNNRILSIDFFPNSFFFVTSGTDSENSDFIKYWEIGLGESISDQMQDEDKKEGYQKNLVIPKFKYSFPKYHTKTVNVVRFSPNGNYLASGSDDNTIIIWIQRETEIFGTSTKEKMWSYYKTLRGVGSDVLDLSWFSDCIHLVSCAVDGSILVYDFEKGSIIQRLEGHDKKVQGIAVDPLLKYIASASTDRSSRIYKMIKSTKKNKILYGTKFSLKRREFKTNPEEEEKQSKERENEKEKEVIQSNITENEPIPELKLKKENENSAEAKKAKSHMLFMDENDHKAFFRRLAFSPDGNLLLIPAGIYLDKPSDKAKMVVYGFTRNNLGRPGIALPGFAEPTVCIKFCPYLFQKKGLKETNLLKLDYAMIFAVATLSSVILYSTESIIPIAFLNNIHFAVINDLSWKGDELLAICSSDGYITFLKFEKNELGLHLPEDKTPKEIFEIIKKYEQAIPGNVILHLPEMKPGSIKMETSNACKIKIMTEGSDVAIRNLQNAFILSEDQKPKIGNSEFKKENKDQNIPEIKQESINIPLEGKKEESKNSLI